MLSPRIQSQSQTINWQHQVQNNVGPRANMHFGTLQLCDEHARQSAAQPAPEMSPPTLRLRALLNLRLTPTRSERRVLRILQLNDRRNHRTEMYGTRSDTHRFNQIASYCSPQADMLHVREWAINLVSRATREAAETLFLEQPTQTLDWSKKLKRVVVPTLLVHGALDPLVISVIWGTFTRSFPRVSRLLGRVWATCQQ